MKQRVITTIVAVLAFGIGSASAQTIGVFFDPSGGSCAGPVTASATTLHVLAAQGGPSSAGITGGEFRIDTSYVGLWTVNPAAAGASLGNPFSGGGNVAFPECQTDVIVSLGTFLVFVVGNNDETITVEQHGSPSNPNFLCALVVLCDSPAFTKVCVPGSFAILNPAPGRDCTVAVEKTSWSEVKGLYN